MSFVIYHRGTGTFFSANDDVVVIDINELSQDEITDLEDGVDTEAIADNHGVSINDETFANVRSQDD